MYKRDVSNLNMQTDIAAAAFKFHFDCLSDAIQSGGDTLLWRSCVKDVANDFPGVFLRTLKECNNSNVTVLLADVALTAQERVTKHIVEIVKDKSSNGWTRIPIRR